MSAPVHIVSETEHTIAKGTILQHAGDRKKRAFIIIKRVLYFRSSTLIPHVNNERHLAHCADSASVHWYGEGLLYQHGQTYYPILKDVIVLDFVHLNGHIYVLKKDGNIRYASLNLIEEK